MLDRSKRLKNRQVTKVLYDLMPEHHEPGGKDNPFILPAQKEDCRQAKGRLCTELMAKGYTIGSDLTVWHLYLVELKPPQRPRQQHKGYLYVGQTSLSVSERIEQHRLGPAYPWKGKPKHSRDCHKGFLQSRLDLIPEKFQQTYFSKESALIAEADLRLHFERLGYKVRGGKERYEQQKKSS